MYFENAGERAAESILDPRWSPKGKPKGPQEEPKRTQRGPQEDPKRRPGGVRKEIQKETQFRSAKGELRHLQMGPHFGTKNH